LKVMVSRRERMFMPDAFRKQLCADAICCACVYRALTWFD